VKLNITGGLTTFIEAATSTFQHFFPPKEPAR